MQSCYTFCTLFFLLITNSLRPAEYTFSELQEKDELGKTALHKAIEQADNQTATTILSWCNDNLQTSEIFEIINDTDQQGNNAILLTALHNNMKIYELIQNKIFDDYYRRGQSLILKTLTALNHQKRSALSYAVEHKNTFFVIELILNIRDTTSSKASFKRHNDFIQKSIASIFNPTFNCLNESMKHDNSLLACILLRFINNIIQSIEKILSYKENEKGFSLTNITNLCKFLELSLQEAQSRNTLLEIFIEIINKLISSTAIDKIDNTLYSKRSLSLLSSAQEQLLVILN